MEKKLPGCAPFLLVYDHKDRLVLSQDGNQRSADAGRWSYSLYDGKNRVVETGEVVLSPAMAYDALQTLVSASDNYISPGVRTALQYTVYDTYAPTAEMTAAVFWFRRQGSITATGSLALRL